MKLKKIASLALAGVMAVSMLTACGGNTIDDTQKPEEPDVTPSTSASAQTLVSNMKKEAQNKVTAVANSDLTAALQSAVTDYFSNADVVKYGKVFEIRDTWYGMTYKEDVAAVKDSFRKMSEEGVYRADLFSDL